MGIYGVGVCIEGTVQVTSALTMVVQGKCQVSTVCIVPVVFVPCDVAWIQELGPA